MDLENRKKRQSLKIIISEALMVIAVIATVTVLAFIVSGYWINSDFEVERQGMLQISSVPTGANVNIDGEASSWLQRTNTSKVLPSGEHTVTLTKDGYDSWSKTIDIKAGLLYRLHYPRLFLKERTPKNTLDLTGTNLAVISSDHDSLLLVNNTTKWAYLDLNSDQLEPKPIDISPYFSSANSPDSATGLFDGEVLDADWDYDGAHVLFKVKIADSIEWTLLDVKNPDRSINLTKEFGANFSRIEMLDNSANTLLAIQNGNLHKIDVPGRHISAVIIKNVTDFDHFQNEVIFSAKNSDSETANAPYYVGFFKVGDDEITELTASDTPTKVAISKFYDKKYLTILSDTSLSVYEKDNPTEQYFNYNLSFAPDYIEVGHDGEFITMYTGARIATLDMEAGLVHEWSVEGDTFGWIDNDMIYTVADGELIVYDFDGLNRRALAKNVSTHFPAGITDNKWLYYVSDDNLMREVIRD